MVLCAGNGRGEQGVAKATASSGGKSATAGGKGVGGFVRGADKGVRGAGAAAAAAAEKGGAGSDKGELRFAFDFVFDSSNPPASTTEGGSGGGGHLMAQSQSPAPASKSDHATQRTVFETLGLATLAHAWRGLNSALFAYGQTGAGKSFSMQVSGWVDGWVIAGRQGGFLAARELSPCTPHGSDGSDGSNGSSFLCVRPRSRRRRALLAPPRCHSLNRCLPR